MVPVGRVVVKVVVGRLREWAFTLNMNMWINQCIWSTGNWLDADVSSG
jgi:hypothetical protein